MIAKAASERERERGKKRIRFKGRGVCGEGTRDEEEEGEASSPLWMTFWQQGLMVSTRKIEIFQVIQGWPHFSLLFPRALSLTRFQLSKGCLWESNSLLGGVHACVSALSSALRAPSRRRGPLVACRLPKSRCIFKRPVTCC